MSSDSGSDEDDGGENVLGKEAQMTMGEYKRIL
jgi:hypothetical protein